jgi:hypothetical protein
MCTGNEAGDGSARSEFGSGLRRCSRRTPSSTKADAADSCRFARRAPRRLLSVCSLTILLTIRAGTNTIALNFLSPDSHAFSRLPPIPRSLPHLGLPSKKSSTLHLTIHAHPTRTSPDELLACSQASLSFHTPTPQTTTHHNSKDARHQSPPQAHAHD